MEDAMPDLYAINLHLQERLEQDWRKEVGVVEAAGWLDKAGLLPDRENGLPLFDLLCAGRIAGQQQRPDREDGAWWIRRLADARDPEGIRQARQHMRTCLPFYREHLHPDWPLSRDNPAFWEEFGKTVAMFGKLENTLTSACYALTTPPASPDSIPPDQIKAYLEWYARVEASRTDTMHVLTGRFGKLLKKDGRVPHNVRTDLRRRLDELRLWRNALCHGTWFGYSEDGAGVLSHYYKEGDRIIRFQPLVTLNEFADLRARIVDTIIRLTEAASIAGYDSALTTALPRKYEPRNTPPEPE